MWTTLDGGSTPIPVPGQRAVMRDDAGTILGTVGEDFRPLQNVDAFAWFAPLVDAGTLELETAGSLREGRRVWIMAKLAGVDPAAIVGSDVVEPYVLMAHGHDGSLALRLGFNAVRTVCANTLAAALDEGDGLLCIRHTSGMGDALDRAQRVIARQVEIFRDSADAWRHLAARTCDDAAFAAYALRVFAQVRGEGEDAAEVQPGAQVGRRLLEAVRPLFEGGAGNDVAGVRGTWWAAYNALTQWLTHARGSAQGSERDRAERRFDSLHLGAGRKLGVRALLLALEGADRSPARDLPPLPPHSAEEPTPILELAPVIADEPAVDLGAAAIGE
jgi:phage/plasmid-like protein (TIGR03299 family)